MTDPHTQPVWYIEIDGCQEGPFSALQLCEDVRVALDTPVWREAAPVSRLMDTVGAGDGFSAVLALGIVQGWGLEDMLERAVEFAADLCGIRGATSQDHGLYEEHRRRWNDGGRA